MLIIMIHTITIIPTELFLKNLPSRSNTLPAYLYYIFGTRYEQYWNDGQNLLPISESSYCDTRYKYRIITHTHGEIV